MSKPGINPDKLKLLRQKVYPDLKSKVVKSKKLKKVKVPEKTFSESEVKAMIAEALMGVKDTKSPKSGPSDSAEISK
jgi:hypothetical protein